METKEDPIREGSDEEESEEDLGNVSPGVYMDKIQELNLKLKDKDKKLAARDKKLAVS